MKRRLSFFLLSVPIGALSGYACSFVIVLECFAWHWVFKGADGLVLKEAFGYAAFVALSLGAFIGGLTLPIAYLALLWRVPVIRTAPTIGFLFLAVLLPSIAFSALDQFGAFFGAIASYCIACLRISGRYYDGPNQSSEPTLASVTTPAGQEPRLP